MIYRDEASMRSEGTALVVDVQHAGNVVRIAGVLVDPCEPENPDEIGPQHKSGAAD